MNEITYMDFRPYISDKGAHISGPMAKPKTKSDKPSVATSSDALKRCSMPPMPLTYTELENVTTNVDRAWKMVMAHFRLSEKFMASWWSLFR
jgi:hypothetical protein